MSATLPSKGTGEVLTTRSLPRGNGDLSSTPIGPHPSARNGTSVSSQGRRSHVRNARYGDQNDRKFGARDRHLRALPSIRSQFHTAAGFTRLRRCDAHGPRAERLCATGCSRPDGKLCRRVAPQYRARPERLCLRTADTSPHRGQRACHRTRISPSAKRSIQASPRPHDARRGHSMPPVRDRHRRAWLLLGCVALILMTLVQRRVGVRLKPL